MPTPAAPRLPPASTPPRRCPLPRSVALLACAWLHGLGACLSNAGMVDGERSDGTPVVSGDAASSALPAGGIRRLTTSEYQRSVADVLGSDVQLNVALDTDVPLENLESVGGGQVTTTPKGADAYASAAASLAGQRFADPNKAAAFVGCTPQASAGAQDACIGKFLDRVGTLAWRRPLSDGEKANYAQGYAAVLQDTNNVMQAAQFMTASLLSSPYFIYRSEIGTGGQLDDYELAARMSYFLCGTTPDATLLQAAATGKLVQEAGLRAEATRLLTSPRAKPALTSFLAQWLGFTGLETLNKDKGAFPNFTATLGPAMKAEFDAVVGALIDDPNADFTTLFTGRQTVLNAELAQHYGVALPSAVDAAASAAAGQSFVPTGFVPVILPEGGPRAGLLTMGGFLAAQAKPTDTAPIARGHYVRSRLLCQPVLPPPPDVPELPAVAAGGGAMTMRQRLAPHTSNPACSPCHKSMDPLGLPLEHFDGVGAYRATDHNLVLDVTGSLGDTPFDGALELGALLQNEPAAQACIVRQVYRQALGQLETDAQEEAVQALTARFRAQGFNFKTLLVDFIASDLFRKVGSSR